MPLLNAFDDASSFRISSTGVGGEMPTKSVGRLAYIFATAITDPEAVEGTKIITTGGRKGKKTNKYRFMNSDFISSLGPISTF